MRQYLENGTSKVTISG